MTDLVSVVVPTRGGRHRLPQLIAGLAVQTHPNYEVIVVVDGDIDRSTDFLVAQSDRLPLRVVTFAENRGRSAALNAGFALAKGELLVRCDDDLGLAPQHLARHLAIHQQHEAQTGEPLGLIGMCRNLFPDNGYARVYGRPRDLQLRTGAYNATPDERWRYWAANVSVRTRLWYEIGPYDECFRKYGWEDVDWGWRLSSQGVALQIHRGIEVTHQVAATTTGIRMQRAFASGQAKRRFELKHGLGGLDPVPTGRWGRAIGAVASVVRSGERSLARYGAVSDLLAATVPRALAEKAVAAGVEGAALAGYRAALRAEQSAAERRADEPGAGEHRTPESGDGPR